MFVWVFFFIFGQNYSLSLIFLVVIVFWVVFFITTYNAFRLFSFYSNNTSLASSFILVLIASHLGVFGVLSNSTLKLIFFRGTLLNWAFFALFMLSFFVYLIFSGTIRGWIKKWKAYQRLMDRRKKEEIHQRNLSNIVENLNSSLRGGNGS